MEDNKRVSPEFVRQRRVIELREYALAISYPLTHSGISAHHNRTLNRLPLIAAHPRLGALAEAVQDAVTPQGKRLQHHIGEHANQPSVDEPKPGKKSSDK